MNLLLLYRIKCLPKNTNGRLAIPALAGLLVLKAALFSNTGIMIIIIIQRLTLR